jgi:protein Mpv17
MRKSVCIYKVILRLLVIKNRSDTGSPKTLGRLAPFALPLQFYTSRSRLNPPPNSNLTQLQLKSNSASTRCVALRKCETMIPRSAAGRTCSGRRTLQRYRPCVFNRLESTNARSSKVHLPDPAYKSIPGPIWIWTQPLNSYTRMHSRRPYTVQLISTLIIYLIGDLTAQSIAPSSPIASFDSEPQPPSYDPLRTLRALTIGGLAAIPGYHWFVFLARNFNYTSKAFSIAVKVLVNQAVFTPIFNSYFFGMQSALSGAGVREVVERIKHTVPTSWLNSWKLWPAVTAFSFTFIRLELRPLFAGSIAIGWQAYLSLLNQRAVKMEREEQAAVL